MKLIHNLGSVYYSTKVRQYDNFSCRIMSLMDIRNSLLHISLVQPKSLKEMVKDHLDGDKISSLPPEWDYTNQI